MEQIPSYNLLQAIDPTKIKVPISERFAKLTLSSNKKKQQKCDEADEQQNAYKIQKEKRDSVTRDISKQFEIGIQEPKTSLAQNPLLRSESSKETNGKISLEDTVAEEFTMEPLEVSEDAEENDDDVELLSQQIASLIMQEPKPISLSSGSTGNLSVYTDLLSSESQPSSVSETERIRIVHHIPINVKEAVKQEAIAFNITPTNDSLEKTYEMTDDEETGEEDKMEDDKNEVENIEEEEESEEESEDEAITISDTSGSHHEPEQDIMATSSLPSITLTSENLSLPSQVADKAERVAAFLRDVSIERHAMNEQGPLCVNDTVDQISDNKEIDKIQATLAKSRQIATADTESMTADIEEEITPKTLRDREKRLKALGDFEENNKKNERAKDKEQPMSSTNNYNEKRLANDETLDNTINTDFDNDYYKEKSPKVLSVVKTPLKYCSPTTPKACTADVYKLANDETQYNTDISFNEETSKILAYKEKQEFEKLRRIASLDTEDVTVSSFKENSLSPVKENVEKSYSNMSNLQEALMQQSGDKNCSQGYTTPERDLKTTRNNSALSLHSKSLTDANQNSNTSQIYSSGEEFNGSVPEASITISETDDDDDKNLEEEKSNTKNESLDDKKLSNSFHREESSDDSEYEQQISKIQMSMASINISAKINIKIHIPNNTSTSENSEDEQNDEPHVPNNGERESQQSKQLTDQSAKTSNDEIKSINDKKNQSKEKRKVNSDYEIGNNCSLDKTNIEKKTSYDKDHTNKPKNQSLESACPQRTCKQRQTKTPKGKNTSPTNTSSDSSIEIVEDEKFLTEAEKLLTQLYGKSWQTPDVIRTLKRSSQSGEKKSNDSKSVRKKNDVQISKEEKINKKSSVEESILDDFSIFRRNIVKTNLDSTRLVTPKSIMPKRAEILTEPRNGAKISRQETDSKSQSQTERKTKAASAAKVVTNKGRVKNDRWRQLIDDDSNSEGDNASDDDDADESWSKNASELDVNSSDSDFEISPKPKTGKARNNTTKNRSRSEKSDYLTKVLNKSKAGELVYLDLSQEEVTVQEDVLTSPPANRDHTFASRLQDILKTCRHEDKPKLPSSNKKSRKKLFTPNFGDDDFEDVQLPKDEDEAKLKEINKENNNEDELLDDSGNSPFDYLGRPKLFNVVNKQLESVKTGKPIFQLTPSPKKKDSKINTKAATNSKSTTKAKANNEAIFKTPVVVKSKTQQSTALKNLCQTPNYKYSFLKSLDVAVSKSLCHPDALYYRDNYRTKKEDLSRILYDMYNEKLFDNKLEVPLSWNKKLLNTAGRCLNKKKLGIRSSVVELSEKVLTSADRLRCTLIHELCHAATWIFDGESGHGTTWKGWARKANVVFPEIPKIGVCHQYDIEYKYTYKCTLCAAKSHAHSKSKKVENIRCSYCHGAIEIFLNKKDKDGNVVPTPVREATGFAKFVKDNYKKFKRDDLKHADVMKLLSNEFASLKVTSN